MWKHYLKIAFRNLLKYKWQNLISIVGLALGLTCFSLCLYFFRYVNDTDKYLKDYKRIAQVIEYSTEDNRSRGQIHISRLNHTNLFNFLEIERITGSPANVRSRIYEFEKEGRRLPYNLRSLEVDTNFLHVFKYKILEGRKQDIYNIPNSVVLTQKTARKIFGDEYPIGHTCYLTSRLNTFQVSRMLEEGVPYIVTGVIEDIPINNSMDFLQEIQALVLNDQYGSLIQGTANWEAVYYFALLHPSVDVQRLNKKLNQKDMHYPVEVYGHFNDKEGNKIDHYLQLELLSNKKGVKHFLEYAYLIGIVGTLILIVTYLNFFLFVAGGFINRMKEYIIRKGIGAETIDIYKLLFTHLLLMHIIAFLLLMCFLEIVSGNMSVRFNTNMVEIPVNYSALFLHTAEYFFYSLVVCLCFAGCISWFTFQKIRLAGVFEEISLYRGKKLQSFLLGLQIAICFVFTIGTTILFLQSEKANAGVFSVLSSKEKKKIICVNLEYKSLKGLKDKIISDIELVPGIAIVTKINSGERGSVFYSIEYNEIKMTPLFISSDTSFLDLVKTNYLKGRKPHNENEILIDSVLAGKLRIKYPGETILVGYSDKEPVYVTGIVSAFPSLEMFYQSTGTFYRPGGETNYLYIQVKGKPVSEVCKEIEQIMINYLPESSEPDVQVLSDIIEKEEYVVNLLKKVLFFFAGISIFIILLGVFSAITLDAEKRKKEVALHKINGAHFQDIILLFGRRYIWILLVVAILVFPLIYWAIKIWFEMSGIILSSAVLLEVLIFIPLVITLLIFAIISFSLIRIFRINPAETLKSE